MIDKDVFRTVFADFDADIINQIIKIYISEHPVKFRDLEASLERRDFNKLRFTAHGLKGVLSQFFAKDAQQQAKDLEFFSKELHEYYSSKPGSEIDKSHLIRLNEMIANLKIASLQVIEDLKEIATEYN